MEDEDPKIDVSGSELNDTVKDASSLLHEKGPLMIVVYARWCGHCKNLFDTWKKVSNKVKGKAKVYVIESSDYKGNDVNGFPDMRIVKNGKATKYDGERSVAGMQKALLGSSFGGNRSRRRGTRRFRSRVRKITHRAFRGNIPLV